jgi:hypothetical protein
MADQWKCNTPNGKRIEFVKSSKVLDQIISDDDKDYQHTAERKQATNALCRKLQVMNLTSFHIHPIMKAQMFRTSVKPILT